MYFISDAKPEEEPVPVQIKALKRQKLMQYTQPLIQRKTHYLLVSCYSNPGNQIPRIYN
ncbi:hypothetical protein M8C21_033663 [Ambrosia artemisiifolia]|uniref:Uncharacterized protein n=1 Tax=Ambrosia artemisiifolia TaxID=4212 RepID=A0AAD5BP08_AMBAR|nr:hypothetical protein M8C21_033663 [Ambrosia artemisiifolia]